MSEIFFGDAGLQRTTQHIIGATSLIVWGLMLVVSVKYVSFVLRADHNGEGGVFALHALLSSGNSRWICAIRAGLILAAGLLYGDGIITPAISVLSAVEGFKVVTHTFEPFVFPITVGIIIALFSLQRKGTERMGAWFGPIVLAWFLSLAALGIRGISHDGESVILAAFNPLQAIIFLQDCGLHGALAALSMGLLAITGCEALYADMGHFGRKLIRNLWYLVPFPALILI